MRQKIITDWRGKRTPRKLKKRIKRFLLKIYNIKNLKLKR